jgi:hypothetical protein
MRRLWLGLGFLFLLLVAGVIGLNIWVHAYLRSEAFRQLVSAKTGQALRMDAEYQPLSWAGSSVFSEALKGAGLAGAPIESLNAEQVRANVNWKAIFDGAWQVERVDVVRLNVDLRTVARQSASATEPGPTPEPVPPKKGFLPNRFQLDLVSVEEANLTVDGIGGVRHTALTVRPEGNGWVFDGVGGQLELAKQQSLGLTDFRLRLQQGVVYVTDANLRLGNSGMIKVSGEVGGEHEPFDLRFSWDAVNAADLLDAEWRGRLTGVLAGEAHSVGRGKKPSLTTGKFLLVDGMLKGLPVQKEIAKFTRSPQFERMPLQMVSGEFTRDGATTTVKNFVAESAGLLRLEGDCRIGGDGALDGTFQVGVTSQSLLWLPGSQEKVFVTSKNGYLWTTVKIGGTVQNPVEDLSDRLARAMGEQVIDTGVEFLRTAPKDATDAVDRALELLTPLIP